jgi:hypothetical protein
VHALAGQFVAEMNTLAAALPAFKKVDGAANMAKAMGTIGKAVADSDTQLTALSQSARPDAVANALRFMAG